MSQAPESDSHIAPLACGLVELAEQPSSVLKQAGIFSDPDLEHTQGAFASAKHGEANQVIVIPHHNDATKSGRTFKAFSRYEPDRLRAVSRLCFNECQFIPAFSCYCGNGDHITGLVV